MLASVPGLGQVTAAGLVGEMLELGGLYAKAAASCQSRRTWHR